MRSRLARARGVRPQMLTWTTLLLAIVSVVAVSPAPAHAGAADDSRVLTAAIYDATPFPLTFVEGWSSYGFDAAFTNVSGGGASLYKMIGSPLTFSTGFCYLWSNSYNGWFTYRVDGPDDTEYVTVSVNGQEQKPTSLGCGTESFPRVDVWLTSTAPPITWRYGTAPPNVIRYPEFDYLHNTPYLFDQTILFNGTSGPGRGTPAIVSLGDSTISGQGGRWAGNTNTTDSSRIDAGSQWYWDTATGESIPDCHRSKSAEVHIGGNVLSANFACAGAETTSYSWQYPDGWRFKPGVDTYCEQDTTRPVSSVLDPHQCIPDRSGQLIQLEKYAATHNVKAVVLAVGANDFDFSDVVQKCAKLYVAQHLVYTGTTCANSGDIEAAVTDAKRAAVRQAIWTALQRLVNAMASVGYDRSQYTVILQDYWSAVPDDSDMRIKDISFNREQQGGCPLLQGDATALNHVLLPAVNDTVLAAARQYRFEPYWPRITLLDMSDALVGHRLCEKGVGEIEDYPAFSGKGTDPSMVDKLEWVTQERSASTLGAPYELVEGGHANYWGQLAERNCLRQAYNDGAPRDGKCVPAPGGGVDAQGEPNMTLQGYSW